MQTKHKVFNNVKLNLVLYMFDFIISIGLLIGIIVISTQGNLNFILWIMLGTFLVLEILSIFRRKGLILFFKWKTPNENKNMYRILRFFWFLPIINFLALIPCLIVKLNIMKKNNTPIPSKILVDWEDKIWLEYNEK